MGGALALREFGLDGLQKAPPSPHQDVQVGDRFVLHTVRGPLRVIRMRTPVVVVHVGEDSVVVQCATGKPTPGGLTLPPATAQYKHAAVDRWIDEGLWARVEAT